MSSVPTPGPGEPWTVLGLVRWSAAYLEGRGVEGGRLDAEHLLAHALATTRLQLYLQYDRPLMPGELAAFKPLLLRRAAREPLQYVLGRASFRELELAVDRRALIPRPETEELVEAVLEWARRTGRTGAALDVGTGSGCIALSLLVEGGFRRVVATDASADALALAEENARRLGVGAALELRRGHLFEPVRGEVFDLVVSNPPYVAEGEREGLQPEVREHEPEGALFAGPEGMDALERIVREASGYVAPGGLLALEVGAGQAARVAELARRPDVWEEPRIRRDLTGRERIVLVERGPP